MTEFVFSTIASLEAKLVEGVKQAEDLEKKNKEDLKKREEIAGVMKKEALELEGKLKEESARFKKVKEGKKSPYFVMTKRAYFFDY